MTEQEQIEEIEQFIYGYVDSKQTKVVYLLSSRVNELAKPFVHNMGIAEALYNAGYRKLHDGATVLLVGKYNQALDEKTIEYFIKHNKQIRKETAREILQCLYDKCYELQNSRGGFAHITPHDILTLAKQYGVEVEE